jgi:nitrous oxidase accessory protein
MLHHMTIMFMAGIVCLMAHAKTLDVCNTCTYKSVAEAYTKANAYDTIRVKAGTYRCEELEIKKPIVLLGEPGAILDGNHKGHIVMILSGDVTISGFRFIHAGHNIMKNFAAIYVRADGFTIINNEIVEPYFAVLMEKSKRGNISNNRIYGKAINEAESGNGIHAWHCSELTISGNKVSGVRDGIYLEFVEDSKILRNESVKNLRYGLHFMFSNRNLFEDNLFQQNGAGVAVMFSKFIQMRRNRFIKNWGAASYGLLLKEIYDAEVEHNTFKENTMAIYIDGCTRINYLNNQLERNGWAIKASGGCYLNRFESNNFEGNSFDMAFNARVNDNTFSGNYWSGYSGYDLNRDGVGDVPYRPVKLFSHIVNKTPEAIVLLRSLFIDLVNFSEQVSPAFGPDELFDYSPLMRPVKHAGAK